MTDDSENYMLDYDGNHIRVTGWFCARCLLPLLTPEEIERRLHFDCSLTD